MMRHAALANHRLKHGARTFYIRHPGWLFESESGCVGQVFQPVAFFF
jgi:hypothetical protein